MREPEPSWAAEERIPTCALVLPRCCTLREAAELKSAVLAANAESPILRLDASGVEQIDCAALQLLVSLTKTRAQSGRATLIVRPSPVLVSAIRLLGLERWVELAAQEVSP